MMGQEANLAWALALAAKPHLNVVERNGLFVAIGAGETFTVVRALVKWFAIKRISVEPDLVRQCVSWLDAYVGHEDERYLRRLVDDVVFPLAIRSSAMGSGCQAYQQSQAFLGRRTRVDVIGDKNLASIG